MCGGAHSSARPPGAKTISWLVATSASIMRAREHLATIQSSYVRYAHVRWIKTMIKYKNGRTVRRIIPTYWWSATSQLNNLALIGPWIESHWIYRHFLGCHKTRTAEWLRILCLLPISIIGSTQNVKRICAKFRFFVEAASIMVSLLTQISCFLGYLLS